MRRILLIDDDNQTRGALMLALRAKGFDVVAAENGQVGLREFHDGPFDLAIVDVFMPGMDGVKLIKTLREYKHDFPIIAISGVLLRASGRTALDLFPLTPELSNIVCLQKPFRPPELLRAIETALGIAAAPRPAAAAS